MIPDTAAPFLSLRRIGPQISQVKLPRLLQYQPEHFTMIHYSEMQWTIDFECKDGRPDNHIVINFTPGESADTPIEFFVNLDVPEAERESTGYTVRPSDANFDIELPVRASDFRAHCKLDFSVELEDD
jgi:hypothetical protein